MVSFHTHYIEVLWFLQSLGLLIWFTISARRAIGMSAYLKANQINGLLQISADNIIQQELLRVAIGAVMVLSAVCAMFLSPPPPSYSELPQSLVMLIAWNIIGALMLLQSIVDRAANVRLNRYKKIEVSAVVGVIDPGTNVIERAQVVRDTVIEKATESGAFEHPITIRNANQTEVPEKCDE